MTTTRIKNKNWIQRNWIYIFSALIVVLCIVYAYHIYSYWKLHPSEAGQFGDMFGTVTALIGSLTFIFLIYSINLQREELELAREEYKLGLAEMQEQNKTSKAQLDTNKALQETTRMQRLETTYFNLIQLYQNRQGFSAKDENTEIKSCFAQHSENENINRDKVRGVDDQIYYIYNNSNDTFLLSRYNKKQVHPYIQNFYNLLINVLNYLHQIDLPIENKRVLSDTLTSLLSQSELMLLFYYMRLKRDYNNRFVEQELFDFANKMKIFDNLDTSQFPDDSYRGLFQVYRRN